MEKVIQQGAEGILYLCEGRLIKERISKGYRLKEIDEKLRKFRTRREAKLLGKVDFAPKVYGSSDKDMKIEMEFIEGDLLKDVIDGLGRSRRLEICKKIGEQIAVLHDSNIIHADLTTSNMLLKEGKIYFIDFGLGFFSAKLEDKAVDLHLLQRALESKHYQHFEECFSAVLNGYGNSKYAKEVIKRLEKVGQRGRYKGKQ